MTEPVRYQEGKDNNVLSSALYDAYKGKCWWCGRAMPFPDAEIDHLLPRSASPERVAELAQELGLDGDFDVHDPRNLGPICPGCNKEKASTDFTKVPRIVSKLRKAENLRPRVIRLVRTFHDTKAIAAALLRAKAADLSDADARRTLNEHAPGFIQAMANAGVDLDYSAYSVVDVERGEDGPLEVEVTLGAVSRRALGVLEDACGGELPAVLEEPVIALERILHKDVFSAFENKHIPGGAAYPGSVESGWLDVAVRSVSLDRSGTYFEFTFEGTFQGQFPVTLLHDSVDPGTLEEGAGEAFADGEFSFPAEWDPSDGDVEIIVGEPTLTYNELKTWIDY
ncbi:HNH endonuclease [Kribbella solani]|uniref:HNH endonuclease n=1 Tax=Kribbella solani TaxID=236067 RepID=A0A841DKC9_9ACTN|nr:HNH endonuclease signature motif containing protein [Kribbella solani]MBB5976897.1 hypothetical protein [Kribbella solani]